LDFVWSGWQSLTQNFYFVGVFIATSSQICWHTKGEGSEKIATDAGEPMEPCRRQYGATVPGSEYSVIYVWVYVFTWIVNIGEIWGYALATQVTVILPARKVN